MSSRSPARARIIPDPDRRLGRCRCLMGLAANVIAKYIERLPLIGYVGLAVIVYVAVKMIYEGWVDPVVGLGTMFR